MGASNLLLLRMVLIQALLVGAIGYGLGVGIAALFGMIVEGSELAFLLSWERLGHTVVVVLSIISVSAVISMRRVMKLEPAVVFRG